jgi:hypothetical protein
MHSIHCDAKYIAHFKAVNLSILKKSNGIKLKPGGLRSMVIAQRRCYRTGRNSFSAVNAIWKSEPEPCDGVNDPDERRMTTKLTP